MDDEFEFLNVKFSQKEAQLILEAAGYTKFDVESGRGPSGWGEMKLCCEHPKGKRMFAEHAWKKERDAMVKRLLLAGLSKNEIAE